ncbi:hypothetical protein AK812_SmicGene34104 [Symbiodinium microadriaticum]|uniref:Uncharacterized protein n=1 Tax=Symbiodinium microadriaticum TaxID=2951 RepID=A0A1Q9CPX4_SYMMI|nr:hypothetical protein AK812_SmicGene34104 [Symbiodinium microadriaticum]
MTQSQRQGYFDQLREAPTLTFLGYHSHAVNQANVGDRRNALARPLHELSTVVLSAKNRKFLRDRTRSGRWQKPSSPVSSASVVTSPPSSAQKRSGAARAKLAVADTSNSSDSAVSADSADDDDDDDDDEQMVAFAPHFVENLLVLGGFTLATNKQNDLLHAVRHDAGHVLCGHLLSANFEISGKFAPLASSATSVAPGTVQLPAVFLQCGASFATPKLLPGGKTSWLLVRGFSRTITAAVIMVVGSSITSDS